MHVTTAAPPALRPLVAADVRFVLELGAEAFAPFCETPAEAKRSVRLQLAEPGGLVEVAESVRDRVGFFVLQFERVEHRIGSWVRPMVAHLNAIAVAAHAQRQGVGAQLLARAERLAEAREAVAVTLMTAATNIPARVLFESAGYQTMARIRDAYVDGQSGLVMIKPLVDDR